METRDQRIERMLSDNPGKSPELCAVIVDKLWQDKREALSHLIPEMFKDAKLSDFGPMEKVILDAWEAVTAPGVLQTTGAVFCGDCGTGKTHAAYALLQYIMEQNPETVALVMSYPDAIQKLRKEFANDTYEELGSVWSKLNDGSFIILDDVSSQKQTDFEVDKFLAFLDHRFNNHLPFLLTTNIGAENFAEVFGDRLASRMWGFCKIVEFETKDRRI